MSQEKSFHDEYKERLQNQMRNQFRGTRERFQTFQSEEHEPLADGEKGGYHIMLWPDVGNSRNDERVQFLKQYLELNDVKVVTERSSVTTELDVRTQNSPIMQSLKTEFPDVVAAVGPVPTTKFFYDCSMSTTHKQPSRKQLLGDIKVTGGEGVKVVVIDQAPSYNISDVNDSPFFKGREGGDLKVTYEGNRERGLHGLMIADVIGGNYTGIAPGTDLTILEHTSVGADYGLLNDMVEDDGGESLFLVNMSYHMMMMAPESAEPGDIESINQVLDTWHSDYSELANRYGNVVFLTAAGNSALNICETYEENNEEVFVWPSKYSHLNSTGWFEYVAATNPFLEDTYDPSNFPSPLRASYSNFGGCVKYTAPGAFCSIKTLDSVGLIFGTSFSTPAALGVMALYAGENDIKSSSDMLQVFDEYATMKLDEPNDADYMVKLGEDLGVELDKSDKKPPEPSLWERFQELSNEEKLLLALGVGFGILFLVFLFHMIKYAILGAREPQYSDDDDNNDVYVTSGSNATVSHSPPQVV